MAGTVVAPPAAWYRDFSLSGVPTPMAGLDHSQLPPPEARDPAVEQYNARLGLVLFAVYLAAYGAYVLVNTFRPALMDEVPFRGVNLAVSSGLGLIVGALVLAVLYAVQCRTPKGGRA